MPSHRPSRRGAKGRERLALLVPSFGHQRYLAKLLASITKQSRKPDEILISDDASGDGSWTLLKAWGRGQRGVRLYRQTRNLGITGNSNFLLHQTKAELVMFLHSDDLFLDPRTLEKLESLLRENPGVVLAAGGKRFLDAASRPGAKEVGFTSGLHVGKDVRRKLLRAEANLVGEPSCVMFRRRWLRGGFNKSFRQLWDVEAWFRMLRQGDLAYLAEPLVGIRRHSAQATRQNALEGRLIEEHLRLFGRALVEEGRSLPAEERYRLLYKLSQTARRHPQTTSPAIRIILAREKKRIGLVEYLRLKIRYRLGRWFGRGARAYQ